jgi:hypothetical protein
MADDVDATIAKLHEAGATDDEITSIIKEKYGAASHAMGPSEQPGTNSAFGLQAASKGIPAAADALMSFGTSPTAAKTIGGIARGGTTLAAAAHGIYSGSPSQVLAAPMEGWAAGKGGYFLGRAMQGVARPVSTALDAAAPVAKILGRLSGVQGVNDLAQMAEPNRTDIGFLGMGASPTNVPAAPEMTPEQRAAYEQTWQGKIGRLLKR